MSFLFRSTQLHLPKHTRSVWTKITATGSSVEECVQVSIESLKQKQPDVCVVLASKSFSLKHYRQLSAELNKRLKPTVLLGGVVDRVPQVGHGISLLLGFDEKIVPFTIKDSPHRHKIRSISVGRWGRVEEKERLQTQSDHIDKVGWGNFGSISTPVQTHILPPGIIDKPSFVLSVSDNEPDELLQALDHHFPDVPKIGILGSSTPFVTGQPYALFRSTDIMGSGIVGFASYGSTGQIQVEHTAMQKLGEPIKITRCRGNIILDLDEAGATGLLLKLIHSGNKISKDEEFYLGVYPLGDQSEENVTVSRITSGDPSRGNMSVDTTVDLQVGQTVQFMRKKPLTSENVSSDPTGKDKIVFGVSNKDYTIDASPVQIPDEASVFPDVFGGVSENGVIVGRSNIPSEVLDVPFSKVTFSLK